MLLELNLKYIGTKGAGADLITQVIESEKTVDELYHTLSPEFIKILEAYSQGMNKYAKKHCNSSNSKTYHDDNWVKVEVMVYSNELVKHIVETDTVLTYSNIKVGGNKVPSNFLNRIGESIKEGYISLQSEGHPVEFKNIKIKEL